MKPTIIVKQQSHVTTVKLKGEPFAHIVTTGAFCQNPYCEAIATHQAPHNEQYCSECIHEHVYDDGDI